MIDYVFLDAEGNVVGGTYVRPNDPAGDIPIWWSAPPGFSEKPVEVKVEAPWTNPYPAYHQVKMPQNAPARGVTVPTVIRYPLRRGVGGPVRTPTSTNPLHPMARGLRKPCPAGYRWNGRRCVKKY